MKKLKASLTNTLWLKKKNCLAVLSELKATSVVSSVFAVSVFAQSTVY